jgi:hypothetical protein
MGRLAVKTTRNRPKSKSAPSRSGSEGSDFVLQTFPKSAFPICGGLLSEESNIEEGCNRKSLPSLPSLPQFGAPPAADKAAYHVISPAAGRLTLSPGRVQCTNRSEHPADVANRASVARIERRERLGLGLAKGVEYGIEDIEMMKRHGYLTEAKADDPWEIGAAISRWIGIASGRLRVEE